MFLLVDLYLQQRNPSTHLHVVEIDLIVQYFIQRTTSEFSIVFVSLNPQFGAERIVVTIAYIYKNTFFKRLGLETCLNVRLSSHLEDSQRLHVMFLLYCVLVYSVCLLSEIVLGFFFTVYYLQASNLQASTRFLDENL